MSSRTSVTGLVTDHLDTLRDVRTHKRSVVSLLSQFGAPAAIGVAAPWLGFRLHMVGTVVAGVSILAALLFALIVFVFQLRLQAAADPRIPKGGLLHQLIDQLFANVAYSVSAGLLAAVVAVISSSVTAAPSLNGWWTGIMVALTVHFAMGIAMCMKRLRAAYRAFTR